MIAKVVSHGKTREAAIDTLLEGLDRYHVEGLQSNAPFLAACLEEEDFRSGEIHTGYIAEKFPDGFDGTAPTEDQTKIIAATAAFIHAVYMRRAARTSGRMTPAPRIHVEEWDVLIDGDRIPVEIDLPDDAIGGGTPAKIWMPELDGKAMELETAWLPGEHLFDGMLDGEHFAVEFKNLTEGLRLRHRGYSTTAIVATHRSADLHALLPEKDESASAKQVTSPMPGLVVKLEAEEGQEVKTGEPLLVVEAMKMENVIRAEMDGVIKTIGVEAGQSVSADELLIEFE
jgi:propionyl-CoA carboxylase alpha chain